MLNAWKSCTGWDLAGRVKVDGLERGAAIGWRWRISIASPEPRKYEGSNESDWMIYPRARGGRGLELARMIDDEGLLLFTCGRDGCLRIRIRCEKGEPTFDGFANGQ